VIASPSGSDATQASADLSPGSSCPGEAVTLETTGGRFVDAVTTTSRRPETVCRPPHRNVPLSERLTSTA